jgi:type I restriction enzyme S subunit
LAVVASAKLSNDTLRHLKEAFEESDLPFRVEVLDWHAISPDFQKVIEKEYEVIQGPKSDDAAGDSLPAGWRLVKLGDLGEVNRGRSRHRPRYAEHLYGGPYPFVQTGDIKNSAGRVTNYQQTYSEAGLAQSRLWPAGTICITIAANIAETGVLGFDACFPDSVVGFIADQSKCDIRFIEYTFRHLKNHIQHEASGSVQDNINLATLERLRFPLPPLAEQRAIAHILGTLDDKIELNRRVNETLEAMAQALFKSWFVDFDPVRAKAEGRDPGLPKHLADLFPDSFEESRLGKIPNGWRPATIRECCRRIENGGTPSRSKPDYWNPAHIPWLTSAEVRQRIVLATENQISEEGFRHSSAKIWPSGTTVVALYGATAGQVCMIARELCTNQACCGLVPLEDMDFYVYFCASSSIEGLKRQARGSAQQNLSQQIVGDLPVLIATPDVCRKFHTFVQPCFKKWINNLAETETLAALRDTLLPKLISGEIRVKEELLLGRSNE